MAATVTRMSPDEIHQRLNEKPVELVQEAAKEGLTLSGWLERINPTEKGDELDAYERQLKEAGIVTTSDPTAGRWASPAIKFFDSPAGRALYPEFFARQWRKVSFGGQRAIFLNDDANAGSWQRPYVDAQMPRWDQRFEPAIPLSEVVAMTTPISGADYRAMYLTYNAENLRMFRVGESAEIPIATLEDSERVIRLKKYGRGLRASYEQLRRTPIDKMSYWIQLAAVQAEADKVAAAITTLVNGDGNSGTTPESLDINGDYGQTLGTLNLNGWLQFEMEFEQPYMMTTALMNKAEALDLRLMDAGSTNTPLATFPAGAAVPSVRPINRTASNVAFGWTSDVPTNFVVGLDRRFALEHVTEIGADISETERFITNQTQVMVMSEVSGFAILDPNAVKLLDVND